MLTEYTTKIKNKLSKAGIDFIDGDSAIVPVMLYDAKLSQVMAEELLKKGIYVIGFFFPVVLKSGLQEVYILGYIFIISI